MERNMSIRPTRDNCCGCNGCGAKNYESKFAFPDEKKVDVIYEVRVGSMVNFMCSDCLDALKNEIMIVRSKEMLRRK